MPIPRYGFFNRLRTNLSPQRLLYAFYETGISFIIIYDTRIQLADRSSVSTLVLGIYFTDCYPLPIPTGFMYSVTFDQNISHTDWLILVLHIEPIQRTISHTLPALTPRARYGFFNRSANQPRPVISTGQGFF